MRIVFGGLLTFALIAAGGVAQAKDEFESVHCNSDVRAVLVGKKMSDEPVVQTEKRHADLGLKDLGGDELSDSLNSVSWQICGKQYFVVADTNGVIRDALALPPLSKTAPQFTSLGCKIGGKPKPDLVVGVYDNTGAKGSQHDSPDDLLPATAAWTIDAKTGKMSPLSVTGLKCPRIDITSDGSP